MSSSHRHARLSVAPMMDWTDRHCRFFHRLIAPSALLYTEMLTTGAVLHGDLAKLLGHDAREEPCILQLGGSEPEDLAKAARIGMDHGYAGLNLNCGCPSERVQKGAFGACLMREPQLVAECMSALLSADPNASVKHRIGVDGDDSLDSLLHFIEVVSASGCTTFVVHARTAILKGLSPKENREIPPLKPDLVRQAKRAFPHLCIIYNGGVVDVAGGMELMLPTSEGLPACDGLMLGRAAYHDPWILQRFEQALGLGAWNEGATAPSASGPQQREDIIEPLEDYYQAQLQQGVAPKAMARHWHGLFHGMPGARYWRRALSEGESPAATIAAMRRLAREPIDTAPNNASPSSSHTTESITSVADVDTTRTSASQI